MVATLRCKSCKKDVPVDKGFYKRRTGDIKKPEQPCRECYLMQRKARNARTAAPPSAVAPVVQQKRRIVVPVDADFFKNIIAALASSPDADTFILEHSMPRTEIEQLLKPHL